jgi:hypothetical protein
MGAVRNRRRDIDRAWKDAPSEAVDLMAALQESLKKTTVYKEENHMARAKSTKTVEPATIAEVRAFFAENPEKLPEGYEALGSRGRLSASVKEAFTEATKRPVA